MIRPLVVVVIGLAALVGCGSKKEAPTVPPAVAWVEQVCKAVDAGSAKLSALPVADPADPVKTRQGLVTYLGTLAETLNDLTKGIKGAGVPPVTNGQAAVDAALVTLTNTRTELETATAKLRDAPVTDPASLEKAITEAGVGLAKLGTEEGPTKDLKANPELADAFTKAPTCQRLDSV